MGKGEAVPGWKKFVYPAALAGLALSLPGCASIGHVQLAEGEAPIVQGPPARDNVTPLAAAYSCMSQRLHGIRPVGIGVGDVKDYTGKFSDQEGQAITQGSALMVMSALGKLGPAVRLHERFDTKVAEMELIYMDRRQLGNDEKFEVDGKLVPWEPYYGGTIHGSDYFIVGGITELNYNIQSGGAEFQINQIGPKARTYVMNIAADLRIVNTRSLIVERTVSLQKQIVGYEVGAGVFRFFNSNLVDVNTGAKNQEPLQLGVRTVLELGTLELLSAVTDVPFEPCLFPEEAGPVVAAEGAVFKTAAAEAATETAQAEAPARPAPGEATPAGPTHTVQSGETVYSIARDHGVSQGTILAANDLAQAEDLEVGQRLTIPGGREGEASAPSRPASQHAEREAPAERQAPSVSLSEILSAAPERSGASSAQPAAPAPAPAASSYRPQQSQPTAQAAVMGGLY